MRLAVIYLFFSMDFRLEALGAVTNWRQILARLGKSNHPRGGDYAKNAINRNGYLCRVINKR